MGIARIPGMVKVSDLNFKGKDCLHDAALLGENNKHLKEFLHQRDYCIECNKRWL